VVVLIEGRLPEPRQQEQELTLMKPRSQSWRRAAVAGVAMGLFGVAALAADPVSAAPETVNPPPISAETQTDKPTPLAAPEPPKGVSYEVAQVAKLAQAGVAESVLRAYVENSKCVASPRADELLYLTKCNVSPDILTALIKRGRQLQEQAAQALAAPAAATTGAAAQAEACSTPPASATYTYNYVYSYPSSAYAPVAQPADTYARPYYTYWSYWWSWPSVSSYPVVWYYPRTYASWYPHRFGHTPRASYGPPRPYGYRAPSVSVVPRYSVSSAPAYRHRPSPMPSPRRR
jgi:hypothetical protein